MQHAGLVVFLFAFWLALSGHYTPFLVGSGALASLACAWAAHRLRIADHEALPLDLLRRAPGYVGWLLVEIARSAWAVSRVIVHPRLPISPTMTVVRATQRTSVGIATFGNSITLTPGTITTDVRGNLLTVHALVRDGALDVEAGGMDARVTAYEGEA
jgi:multicomponent Na+:H+ antiporter subunit E